MKPHSWPSDADGDVFRKLEAKGFDFSKNYVVDFNIDFDEWPPTAEALETIKRSFPDVEIYDEDRAGSGYLLFKIKGTLTYELVVNTQALATNLVSSYGGRCESWGVLH